MATSNASLSMHNFNRSLRVPIALGLDPSQPRELARLTPPNTPKVGRRPHHSHPPIACTDPDHMTSHTPML